MSASLRLLGNLVFLGVLALCIALAVWLGWAFHQFLYHSPYFQIQRIQLGWADPSPSGDETRIEYQIRRRLAPFEGHNLIRLDTEELRRIAAEHPKIRTATVTRHYPNRVDVLLRQRRIAGIVLLGGLQAIDEDGVVLENLSTRDPQTLLFPVITGLEAGRVEVGARIESESLTKALLLLICLQEKAPALSQPISEVHLDKEKNLTLFLKGGTEIRFGTGDPIRRMPALVTFAKHLGPLDQYAYVDLRFDDQVPALPKEGPAPPDSGKPPVPEKRIPAVP